MVSESSTSACGSNRDKEHFSYNFDQISKIPKLVSVCTAGVFVQTFLKSGVSLGQPLHSYLSMMETESFIEGMVTALMAQAR